VRFRVFRRLKQRGLVLVEATNDDRVRVAALDCWLRSIGEGGAARLRVALGARDAKYPDGDSVEGVLATAPHENRRNFLRWCVDG
jgi:hypothetical protein